MRWLLVVLCLMGAQGASAADCSGIDFNFSWSNRNRHICYKLANGNGEYICDKPGNPNGINMARQCPQRFNQYIQNNPKRAPMVEAYIKEKKISPSIVERQAVQDWQSVKAPQQLTIAPNASLNDPSLKAHTDELREKIFQQRIEESQTAARAQAAKQAVDQQKAEEEEAFNQRIKQREKDAQAAAFKQGIEQRQSEAQSQAAKQAVDQQKAEEEEVFKQRIEQRQKDAQDAAFKQGIEQRQNEAQAQADKQANDLKKAIAAPGGDSQRIEEAQKQIAREEAKSLQTCDDSDFSKETGVNPSRKTFIGYNAGWAVCGIGREAAREPAKSEAKFGAQTYTCKHSPNTPVLCNPAKFGAPGEIIGNGVKDKDGNMLAGKQKGICIKANQKTASKSCLDAMKKVPRARDIAKAISENTKEGKRATVQDKDAERALCSGDLKSASRDLDEGRLSDNRDTCKVIVEVEKYKKEGSSSPAPVANTGSGDGRTVDEH